MNGVDEAFKTTLCFLEWDDCIPGHVFNLKLSNSTNGTWFIVYVNHNAKLQPPLRKSNVAKKMQLCDLIVIGHPHVIFYLDL